MKITKNNQYGAYATATQTVAQTRQVVMLFDGAIRFMKQAKEAIARKDFEERYNLLVKTSEILMGLQGALDFEKGADIAKILYGYYASIDSRLFAIHRTNDLAACDHILKELKEMRDAWEHVDSRQTVKSERQAYEEPVPAAVISGPATVFESVAVSV